MRWHTFHTIMTLAAIAAPFASLISTKAQAAAEPRISGPIVHDNLAIYFIHGPSAPGPVPLTLKEAMTAGKVTVHETGQVNSLTIENTGAEEVFVQAGDIVKGGQQDRVLTVSFVVPPRSGKVPIGAFCVEQGRWSARGMEDKSKFASSEQSLPSRVAKLAMMAPPKPASTPAPVTGASNRAESQSQVQMARPIDPRAQQNIARPAASTDRNATAEGSGQSGVWASVAEAQAKLSANVGANVRSAASASSLQLALENQKLAEQRTAYIARLKAAGEAEGDIVGFVFAVNGKINSGDVYPSNGLFRKMWTKLLEASATEAIAEKDTKPEAAPSLDDVRAFIAKAETGSTDLSKIDARLVRERRETDKAFLFETRSAAPSPSAGFLHRSYLAR